MVTLKHGSVLGDPVTANGTPIVGGFFSWLIWLFKAIVAIVRTVI